MISRIIYVRVTELTPVESQFAVLVVGLLNGEVERSPISMMVVAQVVHLIHVTAVGIVIKMSSMFSMSILNVRVLVLFDNNSMRIMQRLDRVLNIKVAVKHVQLFRKDGRYQVMMFSIVVRVNGVLNAMMNGVFVPVNRLFTRFINFLGRRLLIFLLWLFGFLRLLRFLRALIHLLLSHIVRLPFMVSIVWIILNLRTFVFVVTTFSDRRLVSIVVAVRTLFNHLRLVINRWLWLLPVEFVMVMASVMASVMAMAVTVTIVFVIIRVVIIFVVVFNLVMMSWLHLPVVVNVTLRCVPVSYLLYECMLDDRRFFISSIVMFLALIFVFFAVIFVMLPFVPPLVCNKSMMIVFMVIVIGLVLVMTLIVFMVRVIVTVAPKMIIVMVCVVLIVAIILSVMDLFFYPVRCRCNRFRLIGLRVLHWSRPRWLRLFQSAFGPVDWFFLWVVVLWR